MSLRIAIAQINPTIGDLHSNLEKHIQLTLNARDQFQADLILFPELSLTGYPPEDLLLRRSFIQDTHEALNQYISSIHGIYSIIGHPFHDGDKLFNSCTLTFNGNIIHRYHKQILPNYGVFDEYRYFSPGKTQHIIPIKNIATSILICEDIWSDKPIRKAAQKGAQLILCPNASPYVMDKHEQRIQLLKQHAKNYCVNIVYTNQVGGQDDLVFDGGSMTVTADQKLIQLSPFFKEELAIVALPTTPSSKHFYIPSQIERLYQALVLSVQDYMRKNEFKGVYIGASGGIDSALTLAIATDALGSDQVEAVIMPSCYTQAMSIEDAHALANALNIATLTLPINPSYQTLLETLAPAFQGKANDITEENLQARIRGILLMALANKHKKLVLTTGNHSELAVGYCTLYGDMVGAFAVLKDVPKTLVYQLANYRNSLSKVIPERSIIREPSAELAPMQKDQDTLPPYDQLDELLMLYQQEGLSCHELIANNWDETLVQRIIPMLHQNEYKRRQAAIGPRIKHQSFGRDWRYPITHHYKK